MNTLRDRLQSSCDRLDALGLADVFDEARGEMASAYVIIRLAAANNADADETIARAASAASRVIQAVTAYRMARALRLAREAQ